MNKCVTCNKDTSNPKFCSRSCAAKTNNKVYQKIRLRRYREENCLYCGTSLHGKRVEKFCNKKCEVKYNYIKYEKKFELGLLLYPQTIKKILLKRFGNICKKCKKTTWNNLLIPLDLNHIDGNSNNNIPSNLELICPNCHAQTPNYKIKNKGNGRFKRRERYNKKLSY
jgi:5-methylcytosine-specific restriction endonuclease McrA